MMYVLCMYVYVYECMYYVDNTYIVRAERIYVPPAKIKDAPSVTAFKNSMAFRQTF